jgi:hypothetical protein
MTRRVWTSCLRQRLLSRGTSLLTLLYELRPMPLRGIKRIEPGHTGPCDCPARRVRRQSSVGEAPRSRHLGRPVGLPPCHRPRRSCTRGARSYVDWTTGGPVCRPLRDDTGLGRWREYRGAGLRSDGLSRLPPPHRDSGRRLVPGFRLRGFRIHGPPLLRYGRTAARPVVCMGLCMNCIPHLDCGTPRNRLRIYVGELTLVREG